MNIFALDADPELAASFHCDKHVVKMILESSQMMSTCHSTNGGDPWYRTTHQNHPCSIWVRRSRDNYKWVLDLFNSLCSIYTGIYGKIHKCSQIVETQDIPPGVPRGKLTPFALAMPESYKTGDRIESYRAYYAQEKRDILTYKSRPTPYWI